MSIPYFNMSTIYGIRQASINRDIEYYSIWHKAYGYGMHKPGFTPLVLNTPRELDFQWVTIIKEVATS